jgi:putative acetyltransferase
VTLDVRIRAGRREDAAAVLELRRAVGAEGLWVATEVPAETLEQQEAFLDAMADAARGTFLVAVLEPSSELVGMIHLGRAPAVHSRHRAELGMIVGARHRGQGVGVALMERALAWASACGLRKLELGVFPENARAIALYEKFGFVREGLRRAEYRLSSGFRDEVLMARFLD